MLAIEIIGGLIALLGGGELLVRSASNIARRLGMSALVVGVVIVGFGTSMPELVTSVGAALRDAPGIAIGNIVGSNIANILLILALAAIMRPFACSREAVLRDGSLVIATAVVFTLAAMTGLITRWMGGVFTLALIAYIVWLYLGDRSPEAAAEADEDATARPLALELLYLAIGLALLIGGANFLVDGAIEVARLFAVPEEVIGLTLVAVGTSLPELATSIIAAIRKQSEIALGNVLGSNIYNTIGISGITALVQPIPVSSSMQRFDLPVMIAVSIGLVVVTATGQRVTRTEGLVLLALYAVYLGAVTLA